jgi:hypothetical protein
MKQPVNSYIFNPTAKSITLTDLKINLDQLLLIVNVKLGAIYYNFASGPRIKSLSQDATSTILVLADSINTSATSSSDPMIIYYDDHAEGGSADSSINTVFNNTFSDTLANANASRKLLTIYNDGPGNLYVLYGDGAETNNFTIKLRIGDYFEIEKYKGLVTAVFQDVGGEAYITEIS